MDETEILTEVKAGNTIAFERLYDCYWLKVYNFAQLYITSSFEVSEVVQDVFVKVWESREMFDETKNFDGFLFIITRNIIFNYSRRFLICCCKKYSRCCMSKSSRVLR